MYRILSFIKKFLNGEISTRKLIKKGMSCGKNFYRGSFVFIDPTFPFLISIGDNVTIAIRTVILSHDASTIKVCSEGIGKLGKVQIGNNVFIGANSTILPNTIIGDNSIIGAGSVVSGIIPEHVVACGNPARVICSTEDYAKKHNDAAVDRTIILKKNDLLKDEVIEHIKKCSESGIVYIK